MFVSQYTTRIELPEEGEGAWVELRPLSWLEQQHAIDKGYIESMQAAVALDWNAVLGQADPEVLKAVADRVQADPLADFDQLEVLKGGVVAWSFEEPVDEEHLKLLEPAIARRLAEQIVGLRREADLGNSSSPSTATSQE